MKKHRLSYSLRKISAVLLAVLVLVTVVGVFFILYAVRNARKEELDTRFDSIEQQIGTAEESLARMNHYLVDVLLNDPYTEQLRRAQTVNARNVAARALLSNLDYDASIWGVSYSIAFYVPEQNLYASRFNHAFPYADNLFLRTLFRSRAERGKENAGLAWEGIVENENIYLCKMYEANGVFFAAWISCDVLFSNLRIESLSPDATISFLFSDQAADEAAEGGRSAVQKKFETKYSEICIVVTDVPYLEWNRISLLVLFILFIFLIVLSVTLYTLWYYQRYIQRPLNAFIHHVREYTDQRRAAKKAGIQELNEAVDAFDMIRAEIEKLRIDLYEEQLTLTQTRLDYYRLQIKPHFFVNCFSLLHAMAQKREYQRIQTFCIKLSSYVRYLFSESLDLMPLERELAVVHDFLDIQQIRYRTETVLQEDIDVDISGLTLPPLSLLTFVENALKHGGTDVDIYIRVAIVDREQGRYLRIEIQDTGSGFPAEMLGEQSADEAEKTSESGHLGIGNIRKRLRLLYGENFHLQFLNNAKGGMVLLELPVGCGL